MSEQPKPDASTPGSAGDDDDRPSFKDFLLNGPDLSKLDLRRSAVVDRVGDLGGDVLR